METPVEKLGALQTALSGLLFPPLCTELKRKRTIERDKWEREKSVKEKKSSDLSAHSALGSANTVRY